MKNKTTKFATAIAVISICLLCSGFISSEDSHIKKMIRGNIKTVEHDGHWFVAITQSKGCGIIHHPDCPCEK